MKHGLGRILLIAMGLVLCSFGCLALNPDVGFHQYQHQAYSLKHGIPQSSIFDIEQDQDGYIWLATHGGLVRFDGEEFVVFGDDESELLPSIMLSQLLLDSQNRMWVVSDKGLGFWANGHFTRYPYDYTKNGNINAIVELADGSILVGANGLYRLKAKGVELFYHEKFVVTSLARHGDSLWVGSVGHLAKLHIQKKSLQHYSLGDNHNRVNQLTVDDDVVWVGTRQGLYLVSEGKINRQFSGYDNGDPEITGLYLDKEQSLWVSTRETLIRLFDSGKIEHIHNTNPVKFPWVVSFFEDREGNMWLGSRTEGILKTWNGWGHRVSEFDGLPTNFLWSISATETDIWFGSNLGVASFDGEQFKNRVTKEQLRNSEIYTILAEDKQIWLGTKQGLALYENDAVSYPKAFEHIQYAQINALMRDNRGALWVGSMSGLLRYQNGQVNNYGIQHGLKTKAIRYLYQSKTGKIYVGTVDGLYLFEDEHLVQVGPKILNAAFVTAITETSDGLLIVGTYRRGLFLFDGKRWQNITRSRGLFSNSSFAIFDLGGYIWVSSHNGVYRFTKDDLTKYVDNISEELTTEPILSVNNNVSGAQQIRCCNGAGTAKGAVFNQTIWLPSLNGAVTLKSENVLKNTVIPPVVIEWLETDKRRIDMLDRSFELDQDERSFTVKFNGLSFQSPSDVAFQYRLLGFDNSWSRIDNQRQVRFNNLTAGSYTFEVRARNNHGFWSDGVAQAEIKIEPMFTETLSYKLLLLMISLTSLGFIFLMLQYRNKRQQTRLQRIVDARTKELSAANQKLHEQNELLQKISHTDSLTQLKNRHFLEEQIEYDIAYFERHVARVDQSRVMTFVLLDIDYFKSINDSYGHKAGDQVLQQFSKLLREFTRNEDYSVRMGGEEFLIVIRDIGRDELPLLVDRLKATIKKHLFKVGNTPLNLTASIGFATLPSKLSVVNEPSWSVLLQLADFALYEAKSAGRDAYAMIKVQQEQSKVFDGVYDLRHELKLMLEKGAIKVEGSW